MNSVADEYDYLRANACSDKGMTLDKFCNKADELGFNGMLKNRDLDAWREVCP